MVSTILTLALATGLAQSTPKQSFYDFKVTNIDGKEVKLNKYKGKVILVLNVASKCGLTPQYEGLEALYKKYKGKGLVTLGFPANDFNSQEPGTEQEIKQFCTSTYQVSFPLFPRSMSKAPRSRRCIRG